MRSLRCVSVLVCFMAAPLSQGHAAVQGPSAPDGGGTGLDQKGVPLPASLEAGAAPLDGGSPQGAGGSPMPQASVDAVVAKVQKQYDSLGTFEAHFEQQYWLKAYRQEKRSSGTVVFKKPGKMDWVYNTPKGNRLVSNGRMLWIYEAELRQVMEHAMEASAYPAALAFLLGKGSLAKAFAFSLFEGEASPWNFPKGWVLIGTPRDPTPECEKALFYVDKQTFQVRRVLILDNQGNRNRLDFSAPKGNHPVDDTRFVFVPPPGATVLHP